MGIKEQLVFPEIDFDQIDQIRELKLKCLSLGGGFFLSLSFHDADLIDLIELGGAQFDQIDKIRVGGT